MFNSFFSFTSYPIGAFSSIVDDYLTCLEKEIDYVAENFKDKTLDTVYIGGGTPTTLEPHQLERLIGYLREKLDFSNNSTEIPDWIVVNYIDEGNPSRSGLKLDGVNNIVIHYVGNPGTTAEQNRNFYNQPDSNVSSHFVVGIDGHVIMCLPLDEYSAASNHRNHDTISIEVCHEDSTGEFSAEAYDSLVKLVDWLMERFDLEADDVIRHYDVTGKMCPLYYVEHEDAWEQFKADL